MKRGGGVHTVPAEGEGRKGWWKKLDDEILSLEVNGPGDQLTIRRLKKKKLVLKDQITTIEDQLLPDIIA